MFTLRPFWSYTFIVPDQFVEFQWKVNITFGTQSGTQSESSCGGLLNYDYMDGVRDRYVFPRELAIKNLAVFDESLPITAKDPDEILVLLYQYGSPATVAQMDEEQPITIIQRILIAYGSFLPAQVK